MEGEVGSLSTDGTDVFIYGTTDCSGTPTHLTSADVDACGDSEFSGGNYKLTALGAAKPETSGKSYIKKTVGQYCFDDPHVIYEMTTSACTWSGDYATMQYVKLTEKPISSLQSMVTRGYYSDDACTDLVWASTPSPLLGCTTGYIGSRPDFACASGAPCATLQATSGDVMSTMYDTDSSNEPINYAKVRFYQDSSCTSPTTYHDPSTLDIDGKAQYNGANVAQTGVMNTDGENFMVGEQVYDGNAPGQVRYFEINYGGSFLCTQFEAGAQSGNSPSIKSIKCSSSACVLYDSAGCTGTTVATLGTVNACNDVIFAKVESFRTGIESLNNDFLQLDFFPPTSTPEECEGRPAYLQGTLDTCQVNAAVSQGHTFLGVQERFRCSDYWSTQYAAATEQPTVDACKALCDSTVDCKAISFGREDANPSKSDNHKCVLCKTALLAGHGYWDTYVKDSVATFVKVTGSRGDSSTFHRTYYSTSDCSGVGHSAPEVRHAGTCRAGTSRDTTETYTGSLTYTATMTPTQKLNAVLSQGAHADGDASGISDAVGCPDVVQYVYSDGLYDVGTSNGVNNHRICSIKFQGPPGTTLSFDWQTFSLSTGSCSSDSPLNCDCSDGQSVTIRDGLRDESKQVGQSICGSSFPSGSSTVDVPNRIVFSGNTARIDFEATAAASTFSVYVNHHYTRVNFHLPQNPSFALGSDISVKWSISSSAGAWDECGQGQNSMQISEQSQWHGVGAKDNSDHWQRQYSCARSSQSDHGWIGLYRNGTCETGAMIPHASTDNPADIKVGFRANAYSQGQQPHECWLGYRSIPVKETRGTVIFKWDEDYKDAGWYSLRYFAGDSSGTVCEVLSTSEIYDPNNIKNEQCLYEPITRGEIYVSTDRSSFSGATERSQLPGYERTINY